MGLRLERSLMQLRRGAMLWLASSTSWRRPTGPERGWVMRALLRASTAVMVCAALLSAPIAEAQDLPDPQPAGVVALEHEGRAGFWVPSALFRVMVKRYERAPLLEEQLTISLEESGHLRDAARADALALSTANARLGLLSTALDEAQKRISAPWEGPAWAAGGFAVGVAAVVLVAWALAETLQITLSVDR